MASPSLDDDIARHDEVLRQYRQQFDEHREWLHRQRDTPSFLPRGAAAAAAAPDDDLDASTEMGTDDGFGVMSGPVSRRPVHEELLEKGKLYQQRREALKEEALRREMREMRTTPKISEAGQKKRYDEKADIVSRFTKLEERRQKRLHDERLGRDQDLPTYEFKPKITKKGRSTTPRVRAGGRTGRGEPGDPWETKRNSRIDDIRSQLHVAELAECRQAPVINEHSERLVRRRKRREEAMHPPGGGVGARGPHYTHADSLLERDRLSKLQMWEKYQQQLMEQQPGNPKITPFAAALDRGGAPACERLYEHSFDRDERRSALQQQQQDGAMPYAMMYRGAGDGGECYHTPRISAFAASLHRDVPVEDALLERHEAACERRDEGMRQILDRERELHRPVINPVSDEIAARLPQTARERLYSQKTDYSQLKVASSFAESREVSPPRPPARPSSSGAGSRRRSSSAPGAATAAAKAENDNSFYRRGERRREQAATRLENLRRAQDQKAMEECTFTPATCASTARRIDPLAVHDRGTQWQRRREQKLHEERMKREDIELGHCTFVPNIPDPMDTVTPHNMSIELPEALPWKSAPDTQLYGGDGRAWGYGEFVERHREARRRAMEKQDAAWLTGKGWKNEVTVPHEFSLGRPSHVASLQQPLSPPRNAAGPAFPAAGPAYPQPYPAAGAFSAAFSAAGRGAARDAEPAAVPAPARAAAPWSAAAMGAGPAAMAPDAYPVAYP